MPLSKLMVQYLCCLHGRKRQWRENMKKKILKVLLLISLLCLVGIYPKHLPGNHTAVAEEAKNIKSESDKNIVKMNDSIQQTVKSWATAFCNRDGETLYKLFDPDKKNEFFQLKYVNSSKDDPEISFGVSSPWPWENDYQINIKDNTAIITYYAMVSDPHVYTWIEKLNLVRRDGLYYVSSEKLKTYDSITTKKELEESIGDFNSYNNKLNYINSGLAYNLNQNALNNTIGAYDALFSAKTAAPYLLNLSGGKCCVKKKYITCTIVQYSFADGDSVDIQMIQPFGKKGIWLVEKINTNKSEKNMMISKKLNHGIKN